MRAARRRRRTAWSRSPDMLRALPRALLASLSSSCALRARRGLQPAPSPRLRGRLALPSQRAPQGSWLGRARSTRPFAALALLLAAPAARADTDWTLQLEGGS